MYKKFAYIYDRLMDDFNYECWLEYIEEIYEVEEVDPKKVLIMACGTGNLSYEMAKKGYDLSCFDKSEDMLAVADQKLNTFDNVKLYRQDMIDFNMGEKFESILAICDSINYILNEGELVQTFKNVYDHLEEGGTFIFDINSYYKLNSILKDHIFVEDRSGIFYTWENYYSEESDICQFHLNFFVKQEDGSYKRFIEQHYEKAYTIKEVETALREAGFIDWRIYREFTFKKMKDDVKNNDAKRIHFVVKK